MKRLGLLLLVCAACGAKKPPPKAPPPPPSDEPKPPVDKDHDTEPAATPRIGDPCDGGQKPR